MDSPVDEIKNKIDVVDLISSYIKVNKAGRNYKALCPFHSEKTPSFMISPERQIWHCFGCGKGGSIFDFIMEMEGLEFGDALRVLAQKAGVELKKIDPKLTTEKTRIFEITKLATAFFIKQLEASKEGQKIQNYLTERGIQTKTIADWQIGYAPNSWQSLIDFLVSKGYPKDEIEKAGLAIKSEKLNSRNTHYDRFRDRIIFPIYDINGSAVGFSGRENPNRPAERMGKYINTPNTLIYDKSKILYGLDRAKLEIKKQDLCILVEGQMDVIMLHQSGFPNAVAASGTSLTEWQLKIIKRYTNNLATAFDMDDAGEMATKKSIDLAVETDMNTKVITLKEGKDPADYLRESVDLWQKSLNQAKGVVEFYLESALKKYNSKTAEGKKNISQIVLPVIKKISNKIEQSHWLQEVARHLQVQEDILEEEMEKIETNQNNNNIANFNQSSADKNENEYKKPNMEEYLLGLILAEPTVLTSKEMKDFNIDFIQDTELKSVFQLFKKTNPEKINLKKIKKKLPNELANYLDHLMFKTEAYQEMSEDFNIQKEACSCLLELKKKYFYTKIDRLNLAIQEAEKKGDQKKIQRLTQEVNQITSQSS